MWGDVQADLKAVPSNPLLAAISNRGFHALLVYRISHWMHAHSIPLIPLILTRLVQIIYAIDIDYRASIDGGVLIVHGVGLVIGSGAIIRGGGQKIYHGVTLGIAETSSDGFPDVEANVVIGAGAKVLGPVHLGRGAKIGANAVVLVDVSSGATAVGVPARVIECRQ